MGTDNDCLHRIFTAQWDHEQKPKRNETKDEKQERIKFNRQLAKDVHTREVFQKLFQSRLYESIYLNLRSSAMYSAADLMWDTPVITQEVLPLLMYAQGKIDVDAAKVALAGATSSGRISKYLKRTERFRA